MGVAAKRHLNKILTQRGSLSVLGVAAKRHPNIIPTQLGSLSNLGVAEHRSSGEERN